MLGLFRRKLCLLGLLALVPLACRSQRAPSYADEVSAAHHELLGRWVLVHYEPEEPLEPMLANLLSSQFGVLKLEFDGQRLRADGVGVSTQRDYQVLEAHGPQFRIELRDPDGVTYDVAGMFQGNELTFVSRTSPWRGRGKLRRL